MSYQRLFISSIADCLLVGDWQPQAMVQRVYWLLQNEPVWVKPLVNKIYLNFKADCPYIKKTKIIEYVAYDPYFINVWQQYRQQLIIRQYNLEQISTQTAKLDCETPQLINTKDLAAWLGLSIGQLENYASNWRTNNQATSYHHRHYHYHWIKKRNGQLRLIEAPKQKMLDAQRQIYLGILDHIPLHESCHGFRKRHSCRTYAEPHAGKNIVLHMDLENFFTGISLRRVHAIFNTIGYSDSVARLLAGICCNQTPVDILADNPQLAWHQRKQLMAPHLPQGSPSSPVLANLCACKLDLRLSALAKKLGATYTRYADDLAFSGNSRFARTASRLPALISHIAFTEGFSVNHRKTSLMRQGVNQRLTGMTLNKFPNIPRKDYDQLKAILYNCVKYGPHSQNRNKLAHFKLHLHGRIAFVQSLNPGKAEKLYSLYRKIIW